MKSRRRHIAVLGGTFDPVHVGHIMVGSWVSQFVDGVDGVMFMLSPDNPLKPHSQVSETVRLDMLRLAVEGYERLSVTDIELTLPRPSYSVNALQALSDEYPDTRFSMLIGSDNLQIFDRWKDADTIISDYGLIVYPRPGYPMPEDLPDGVTRADAPVVELSSTFIRDSLTQGRDMRAFLPQEVYRYIQKHQLYL